MEIKTGELAFIAGPSGAGKSTLFKLLIREELPSSGHISVDKEDIINMKKWKIPYYRREIGFVFQNGRFFQYKTVFENAAFALHIKGIYGKKCESAVKDVLVRLGLESKLKNLPSALSAGEQQKLMIAKAIVGRPSIILADEPFAYLDEEDKDAALSIFSEINKLGTTVLIATKDKHLSAKSKKKTVFLFDGRIADSFKERNN
jgi:cell division transport system ATP-binding protein